MKKVFDKEKEYNMISTYKNVCGFMDLLKNIFLSSLVSTTILSNKMVEDCAETVKNKD